MMNNQLELQAQQPYQEFNTYQQPQVYCQPYPSPYYVSYWPQNLQYQCPPVPYYYQPYAYVQPQTTTNTCIINQYQCQNDPNSEVNNKQVTDEPVDAKSYSNTKLELTPPIRQAKESQQVEAKISKTLDKKSKGHWKLKEHRQYKKFIENNIELLCRPNLKKKSKFFSMMSEVIKTRSASQCRSHHQKFYPKLKELDLIVPQKYIRKMKIQ